MTTTHHERSALTAMYSGLALTVVALLVPHVDHATTDVLAAHIRAGYPTYQARIAAAATTYLVYLSVVGVLGIVSWLWSVQAVAAGRWWPRAACDRAVRARHVRPAVRPVHQGHVRRDRPAADARQEG